MDRGAWWAIIHGVAKSQTRLSDQAQHIKFSTLFSASLELCITWMIWWINVWSESAIDWLLCLLQIQMLKPNPSGSILGEGTFARWLGHEGGAVMATAYGKEFACNVEDLGLVPGSGRSPGGGHDNPLQHSCLENLMDRRASWAAVHGVAKRRTWLSD